LDWLKWFDFTSDPFVTRPLQSEQEFNDLFVKTSSIDKELSSLVNQVMLSPFLKLVVGVRGIGKSTALQYAVNLCHKSGTAAVYVGLYPYGIKQSKEPVFETARQLMQSMAQESIGCMYEVKHAFFLKYRSTFVNWGKYIGLSFDEVEGFIKDPILRSDFQLLKDVLFGFLELINRNSIPMLVAIDNLDKLDAETVKTFLRGAAAQPLFEKLNGCGASVLIAANPELAVAVDKDADLSFLRQKIMLDPLSPKEAENLILRRIRKYSSLPSKQYYDKEAVIYVCNEKKGITRDILNEMRGLFVKAFSQKQSRVTLELTKTGSAPFREVETYYEIVKDEQTRRGAEKLLRLIYCLSRKELDEATRILALTYTHETVKIPVEITQALIEAEVILSDDSLPGGYRLDRCVYQLLREVDKKEWSINAFLDWILRSETVEIVRIQTPGFRAKRLIDRFLNEIRKMKLEKDKVNVLQNGIPVTYLWKNWRQDVDVKLRRARENYEIIDNMDIEDADKSAVYRQIYYILKDFLSSFAKCFAAIKEEPLAFTSKFEYIDNWDFIRVAIHTYQKDYSINFNSYRFIWQIRNNNTAVQRQTFSPTEDDVKEALKHLEEIIVEFSHQLESLLSGYAMKTKGVVEKTHPEFHEALRSYVDKLARKMGYTEDIDQYRVFKVDGDEYMRRGFFKSATNTAELDIVRRKQEVERKNGKIKYHFFIAEVKRETKKADEREILLFLKKCEDLIEILEREVDKLPQVLKPQFNLWFVSFSGFTDKALFVSRKTEKPPRTKGSLINLDELNRTLHDYGLKKFSVR